MPEVTSTTPDGPLPDPSTTQPEIQPRPSNSVLHFTILCPKSRQINIANKEHLLLTTHVLSIALFPTEMHRSLSNTMAPKETFRCSRSNDRQLKPKVPAQRQSFYWTHSLPRAYKIGQLPVLGGFANTSIRTKIEKLICLPRYSTD